MNVEFPVLLESLSSTDFDALVGSDEPYLRYGFLHALEASGCVTTQTGWTPHHFAIKDEQGRLLAFAPVYLKHHSYGEYVFDWAWADAYQRHRIPYYPKVLCAVPFTPSVSNRLLIRVGLDRDGIASITGAFESSIETLCKEKNLSSAHILFPKQQDFGGRWLEREGVQYHWFNHGYTDFTDFLSRLNSSKRKNIKKERRSLLEAGLRYEWIDVSEASAEQLDCFYRCYQSTYHWRGQSPYLTPDFFKRLFHSMPSQCLLLFAIDQDEDPVAAALFLKGERTLYGRYWGCLQEFRFLHFELCYYQGIEYCIANGLSRFDAGAQGEHKLLRGFEPVITRSLHYITQADFAGAIENFLKEEKEYIEQYSEDAKKWLPYRKAN